jgi:hypothetical protein
MSSTISRESFRFLDLPAELRCIIYENIDFSSKKHVLTRSASGFDDKIWPPAPEGATESCITFITPTLSVGILATCRLIHQEAKPIIAHTIEALKMLPLRYIVDWAAACALISTQSPVHPRPSFTRILVSKMEIIGEPDSNRIEFLGATHSALQSIGCGHPIEITINHDDRFVHGIEIFRALWSFAIRTGRNGHLFKVVCKSPFPDIQHDGNLLAGLSSESTFFQRMQRCIRVRAELKHHKNQKPAVELTSLGEAAFAKYLATRETY